MTASDAARPIFHLVCGLPASGKSTLAQMIERKGGAIRFTPDEWIDELDADGRDAAFRKKVESPQWVTARRVMQAGVGAILENGFWLREERERYRLAAQELGARTSIHVLHVPLPVLKARIEARNQRSEDSSFRVTEADLEAWWQEFELPDRSELSRWDGHAVHEGEIEAARV